ncbi:MAG: hypothetical protein COV67_15110 [Nitrospinae bacterium CG11_big_fil_rev_8_21_14_0_20_56_8]|nr:MAG: hypothetical protein COV67_15110 [Nitrospinae bacterium CG11_big_fil_rev_8_21_14_0_20_56_8]
MNFPKPRCLIFLLILGAGWVSPVWAQTAEDWFLMGNRLMGERKAEEAVKAYEESLKLNPNAGVAYYNLGLAYKILERFEDSAGALEEVVRREPDNLDARAELGTIYNYLERWEDAIGQLNIVVHRRMDDAEAHGNLGWAYFNYESDPPFKILTIINLEKAIALFEAQNQIEAAEATREVLSEALARYGETPGP